MKATGWKTPSLCILGGFLVLAVLLAGAAREPSQAAPPEARSVPTVTTIKPERKTIAGNVELPARIEPIEQTELPARITGFVQKILVDIGDRVKQGQVLAELWVPELQAELLHKKALVRHAEAGVEQARRALQTAEAALGTAEVLVEEAKAGIKYAQANQQRWQAEVRRLQALVVQKVVDQGTLEESRLQVEAAKAASAQAEVKAKAAAATREEALAKQAKAQADVKVAESSVDVAKAELQRTEALLQFAQVRAPFDGVVVHRAANTGDLAESAAGKQKPLFVVARLDAVRIVGLVPEADAVLIRKDARVVIRVPVLQREFEGKVARTAWKLDSMTRTLRIEVDLPNPEGKLRPGMNATIAILAASREVWTLRAVDVVTQAEQSFCYRVEDGKALRTPLQIGRRFDGLVEALKKRTKGGEKGLWEDFTGQEDIVQSNLGLLTDGQEVRVVPGARPKEEGEPKPAAKETDDLQALKKARLEEARKTYEVAVQGLKETRRVGTAIILLTKPDEVYAWSVRWLAAQRDLSPKKDDQVAALEDHLKRMKELQQRVKAMSELVSALEVSAARFYQVEAELWLAQEKAKK